MPTISGGTWALGGDTLAHATLGPDGGYCVATVDLTTRETTIAWCAEAKHGFNAAHVTEAGTAVLRFDDAKPSCRTVGTVADEQFDPFPGVPECAAWEGALLGDDAAVWSVIPKEDDIDTAEFFARAGEDYYDLGPGTSGTLVPCADAAYFVRDPQARGRPRPAAALGRQQPGCRLRGAARPVVPRGPTLRRRRARRHRALGGRRRAGDGGARVTF